MRENFDASLKAVLAHEGGYVNHPRDPGGATNMGVTHRTYDAWRVSQGLSRRSVREITMDEVAAIYREQYWDAIRGDALPSGVDYAVFDFAVNSGPARAAKFLQGVLGVSKDGVIGAMTLQAVSVNSPVKVVRELCDQRLAWLKRLKHWDAFGRGWSRRVAEVRAMATDLASSAVTASSVQTVASEPAPGKAPDPATPSNKAPVAIGVGGAGAALTGLINAASDLHPAVQGALVLGLFGLALAGLLMWRNARRASE